MDVYNGDADSFAEVQSTIAEGCRRQRQQARASAKLCFRVTGPVFKCPGGLRAPQSEKRCLQMMSRQILGSVFDMVCALLRNGRFREPSLVGIVMQSCHERGPAVSCLGVVVERGWTLVTTPAQPQCGK